MAFEAICLSMFSGELKTCFGVIKGFGIEINYSKFSAVMFTVAFDAAFTSNIGT